MKGCGTTGGISLIKYFSRLGDQLFVRLYLAATRRVRSHILPPKASTGRVSDERLKLCHRVAERYQMDFSNLNNQITMI
jgi:hypothetical protein